jgi:hypothetical protein
MAKRKLVSQPPPRRRRWRAAALGALAVGAIAAGALWWWIGDAAAGTPRLVLDRDVVDLGYLPFDTPARVVFTLTNGGDGTLRITGEPPVRVAKGC